MEDYRQRMTIERLQKDVDDLHKEVHTMRQRQQDMLDQIKKLKEKQTDDLR